MSVMITVILGRDGMWFGSWVWTFGRNC